MEKNSVFGGFQQQLVKNAVKGYFLSSTGQVLGTHRALLSLRLCMDNPCVKRRSVMDINEKAPGNVSQGGVSSGTDNETGFDLRDKAQRALDDEDTADDDVGEGLTDDERVSREDDDAEGGARVTPGPADEERLPK
ncbi:hypothetical protein [Pseudomonas sp. AB6]|uniref:hypothetical protein n=2 Tax=unclassified Pseudomonas TaxID=196821 RepID=UPI002AB429EC|nr:hypothetical protein [Pseudomonas sp. AB6]MDY7560196.1 hypothetical protein [Pseudomonas sp. AB6]